MIGINLLLFRIKNTINITSETIKTENVLPGLAATAPEAPKHTDYVFTGWDKEFTNVTSDLINAGEITVEVISNSNNFIVDTAVTSVFTITAHALLFFCIW